MSAPGIELIRISKLVHGVLAVLALLLLAGCSSPLTPSQAERATAPQRFAYVTTVPVSAEAAKVDIELLYGGSVVVWRPEAGFAVMGFDAPSELMTLDALDVNRDAVLLPETEAAGWTAWAGGWTAWAGGWTAWAGGWTAWAGGQSIMPPSTFGENLSAWEQVGLPAAQLAAPTLGDGVVVAVIDSGVDTDHPALVGRLAPAESWMDFVDGDHEPDDEPGGAGYGHGTGVAGVIVQVAPGATIMPLRALGSDGSGDVAWVVAAIDWAVAHGADVINLSLGLDEKSKVLEAMLEYAADQGVYIVASAGNRGRSRLTYPAAYGRKRGKLGGYLLSVGSVDREDHASRFSNSGKSLELLAPGERIVTLAPAARVTSWSGTSFAAPIVSGALALGLGRYREAVAPLGGEPYLAIGMTGSAHDVKKANPGKSGLGFGRLDIPRFLELMAYHLERSQNLDSPGKKKK